ncbi:ankyrin [Aspergillus pseudodeflectus]|uniref:Ankyrin n=1 Tax=Aspergillus pseudodeflectus TaxID=176178 RepID=A0ABR4JNZ5_9EURO
MTDIHGSSQGGETERAQLPIELILLCAEYLMPVDLMSLLCAAPGLARALTFQHTTLQDEGGRTILHLLAREGELMKLLLANGGIRPDPKDHCAWHGHEAVVRLLLDRQDVKADSKDNDGLTPISFAAGGGHEAVVRLLLDRQDVDADSKDNLGRTPLLYAAWRGHEAVVRLLLDQRNVEADSKANWGQTPLSFAAGGGHEAVVRLLLDRQDVEPGVDMKRWLGYY